MKPGAAAGAVLAATGAGALAGAVLRATAVLHGAGPEDLLSALALFALAAALPTVRTPAQFLGKKSALALAPAAWWFFADPIRHTTAPAGALLSGTMPVVEVVLAASLIAALWVPSIIARTAIRASTGLAPIAAALGMLASLFLTPMFTFTLGGLALVLADQVPRPSRGWSGRTTQPWRIEQNIAVVVCVGAGALGWTGIRAIIDPSPSSAILCLAGGLCGVWIGRAIPGQQAISPLARSALCGLLTLILLGLGQPLFDVIGAWIVDHPMGSTALSAPFVGLGLLAGLALGPSARADRSTAVCVAIGALVGPWCLSGATGLWCIGAYGIITALSLAHPASRGVGAAVAIAAVAAASADLQPSPSHTGPSMLGVFENPERWAKMRTKTTNAKTRWRAWLPSGMVARLAVESTDRPGLKPIELELEGSTWRYPSRASGAEELAGHLGALLASNAEQVLVLGDDAGAAVHGLLAHNVGRVDVSVPFPFLLQDLSEFDPIRRSEWLQPKVRLHRASTQRLLGATISSPTIVEIVRHPWTDGAQAGLDALHLQAVSRRLDAEGIYVLCTHLNRWPDGGVAALAGQMTDTFAHVQAWLPPSGADSLIWVASHAPISAHRLAERFAASTAALDSLGYAAPEALLGSAVMGHSGLSAWGADHPALPANHRMPTTLFDRPVFHAGHLSNGTDTPSDIWDMTDEEGRVSRTADVLSARRLFLTVVDDATRGEIGAAFDAARTLVEKHGNQGAAILEPLIDPHIEDAWRAVEIGRREGPGSTAWDDARRYATTARMLAPNSARPLLVLGETAVNQGDLSRGRRYYEQILAKKASHIQALDGLARIGRLLSDPALVDKSLRSTTRHAPQDWRTWQNLGAFMMEQSNFAEAIEHLQTAAGLAPDNEAAPLNGLAQAYLAREEAPAALVHAERAVRMSGSGVSLYLRGRAHFDLERYNEAEHDFKKAVLADASLVEARGGIGQIRAMRGDYQSAAEQFKSVLQLDPDNAAARENLRLLTPLLPDEPRQGP